MRAYAAVVNKANNTNNLNLGSSWVAGSPPGSGDIAVWSPSVTVANTFWLGADMNWAGINLNNPGGNITINPGNTLILGASGVCLTGRYLTFNNAVTLGADQTWTMGSNNTYQVGFVYGAVSGVNRTLTVNGGGELWLKGSLSGFSGTINYGAGSRLNVGGSFAGSNVVVNLTSAQKFHADGLNGTVEVGDLTTTNTGAILGGASQNGIVTYQIGARGNNSTWAGMIQNGDNGNSTLITKVGSGTWTLSGPNTHSGLTTISDGKLWVAGSVAGPMVVQNFGTLAGVGSIAGPVTITSGGVLAPGTNSFAALTLAIPPVLQGITQFQINRASTPNCSSLLVTSGCISYGGVLRIVNLGGPVQLGDSFMLFSASSFSNSFAVRSLPATPQGTQWLLTNGILTVVTASPPPQLSIYVTNGLLQCAWSVAESGWVLQIQTNTLMLGLSTNWWTVADSHLTNRFSVSMDARNPAVFYRLAWFDAVPAVYVLDTNGIVTRTFGNYGTLGKLCWSDQMGGPNTLTCGVESGNPLQDALNWAAANGMSNVRLDAATYTFPTTQSGSYGSGVGIVIPSGTQLMGVMGLSGVPLSVIAPGPNTNATILIQPLGNASNLNTPAQNILLDSLYLDGGGRTSVGLWLMSTNFNTRLYRVHFANTTQTSCILGSWNRALQDPASPGQCMIYRSSRFEIGWCRIYNCGGDGFAVLGNDGWIHDNDVANALTPDSNAYTLYGGAWNVCISNNRATNCTVGIGLDGSFLYYIPSGVTNLVDKTMFADPRGYHHDFYIHDNAFTNCTRGIVYWRGRNNSAYRNTIAWTGVTNGTEGIRVNEGDQNCFWSNTISRVDQGIILSSGGYSRTNSLGLRVGASTNWMGMDTNGVVFGNSVQIANKGIVLSVSLDGHVSQNVFRGNALTGIILTNADLSGSDPGFGRQFSSGNNPTMINYPNQPAYVQGP